MVSRIAACLVLIMSLASMNNVGGVLVWSALTCQRFVPDQKQSGDESPHSKLSHYHTVTLFAQSTAEVSDEEYAVYDAAIAKILAQHTVNQLRIISPTVDIAEIFMDLGTFGISNEAEDMKFWKARFPNIKPVTMEDYLANSKRKAVLKRSFNHGFDYVIWEMPAALKPGETPRTEKQWLDNDCFVELSRVGFDREHEQALLYLTYSYGGHRAAGFFVFLAKANNQWTVAKDERVWVS